MPSPDLLNNKVVDISIYSSNLSDEIFKDLRFVNLMNTLIKSEYTHKYKFAIYTDLNLLRTNLFVPVFHTMYLGSSNHNVIITDSKDLWLVKTFPNNKYFIMNVENDNFDYAIYNVKKIESLKEIYNEI